MPQVNYFKAFGSKCFVKNTYENLDKFDPRSDEGIFVRYSTRSKAYIIYNKRTSTIEESLHVSFNKVFEKPILIEDDEVPCNDVIISSTNNTNSIVEDAPSVSGIPKAFANIHIITHELIIGNIDDGVKTRSKIEIFAHCAFVSTIEPKNIQEACEDASWIMAMQEELNQFERSKVWELVPRPEGHQIIGTKWIFKNKTDEDNNVIRE